MPSLRSDRHVHTLNHSLWFLSECRSVWRDVDFLIYFAPTIIKTSTLDDLRFVFLSFGAPRSSFSSSRHHQPDEHSVGLFLNSEFVDFYIFEVSEGVECHEEKRVPPASDDEDEVFYSSTIYEQYKKERRRVNEHFHSHFQVILLSDRCEARLYSTVFLSILFLTSTSLTTS